jgi:acyl-CoA synthetase (AMP-forming)/AMP-acid ligase II
MLATDILLRNYERENDRSFLRLVHLRQPVETYTYRQVLDRAAHWYGAYESLGVRPGEHIVIILKHSLDLYAAFLGALLNGSVPAMFAFPSHKFSEQEYFATIGELLGNANARVLVTYPALATQFFALTPDAVESRVVCTADHLVDTSPRSFGERTTAAESCSDDSVAFLQYSSGTTGIKKGVAISHRALLWQIDQYAAHIDAHSMDCVVSWLPLYHDMGLIACCLLPFLKAIPLVAMCPFEWAQRPSLWTTAVTEHCGTLSWLPNFAYNHMVRSITDAELQRCDLSSLRGLVNCSEPILPDTHRRFVDRFSAFGFSPSALATSYAMAENTFAVTSGGFGTPVKEDVIDGEAFARTGCAVPVGTDRPNPKILVSSGKPLVHTQVEIVTANGPAGNREVGEIVLRSPCLLSEYHGNAVATARSLQDGRYFTGDLGYMADGELYVVGRKKDLVIVGGVNIHPQDVEAIVNGVANAIPGRCVAFGAPRHDLGTEMLVVLAETREQDATARARMGKDIYEGIVARVGIVPGVIKIVDHMSLRKSSSGKMSRSINRERFLAGDSFIASKKDAAA